MKSENKITKEYLILRNYFGIIYKVVSYYYTYRKLMNETIDCPGRVPHWKICASAACFEGVIINWCKLFGSNNEDVHWKKLFDTVLISCCLEKIGIKNNEEFKKCFLDIANMSEDRFSDFHSMIKKYRDEVSVHHDIQNNLDSLPTILEVSDIEINREAILSLLFGKYSMRPNNIEPAKKLAIALYRILFSVVIITPQCIPKTGFEQQYDEFDRMIEEMINCEFIDITEFLHK